MVPRRRINRAARDPARTAVAIALGRLASAAKRRRRSAHRFGHGESDKGTPQITAAQSHSSLKGKILDTIDKGSDNRPARPIKTAAAKRARLKSPAARAYLMRPFPSD